MNARQNGSVPGTSSGVRTAARKAAGLRTRAIATASAALLAGVPLAASADVADMAKDAGLGAGSALVTLVYAPVKLMYATGGLLVGGLAWIFSGGDGEVVETVLTPSVRGDYVVTPPMLTGKQVPEFFGRRSEYEAGNVAAGPPEAWNSDSDGW
ncbi:MAG: hypothetical protein MJE66_05405 [Proteobacteria bacterium]|nr:hypothetical protein [Pseudomonadota bacterium]